MNEKKKILVFIDWFLPGYKAGGPIRSVANMIDALYTDFNFYIVTSDRDLGEAKPYTSIKINEWNETERFSVIYLSPKNQTKKIYKEIINQIDCEKIYLNSLFSYRFTILPIIAFLKIRRNQKSKIIIAPRGMLGSGALKIKRFKKNLFISFVKIFGLFRNTVWHATSSEEKEDIQEKIGNQIMVKIAENIPRRTDILKIKDKENITLFYFLSRISKKKNLKFAIDLFSNLRTNHEIRFDIYGPVEDQIYWQICQRSIQTKSDNIKIVYKNEIEFHQIENIISDYHFFILPTLHENYGHAIYEALSFGIPVITSDQTPWRNLEEKSIGWDISLSNRKKFEDVIQKCVSMNADQYIKMSEAAFKFAQSYADGQDLISKTKKLFE